MNVNITVMTGVQDTGSDSHLVKFNLGIADDEIRFGFSDSVNRARFRIEQWPDLLKQVYEPPALPPWDPEGFPLLLREADVWKVIEELTPTPRYHLFLSSFHLADVLGAPRFFGDVKLLKQKVTELRHDIRANGMNGALYFPSLNLVPDSDSVEMEKLVRCNFLYNLRVCAGEDVEEKVFLSYAGHPIHLIGDPKARELARKIHMDYYENHTWQP